LALFVRQFGGQEGVRHRIEGCSDRNADAIVSLFCIKFAVRCLVVSPNEVVQEAFLFGQKRRIPETHADYWLVSVLWSLSLASVLAPPNLLPSRQLLSKIQCDHLSDRIHNAPRDLSPISDAPEHP
jgi:hypothetical protein